MSFCIQNVLESERYRADNLILSGMPPGPTEPNADQLQHPLKLIVDDLIELYENGVIITTPEYPEGILVRVALVGIIADHPAMCKLCGFADKNHKFAPCTKCTVLYDKLASKKSLKNDFPARNGEEHRRLCYQYAALPTSKLKEEFFKKILGG
ncbi:hypothetical protein MVEN_00139100 [Mycena venus]|uniref:Uncharacterized protein n=1 Tax=Mycena venus TaxID=2733690 RepID=A0A8H6Z2N4_9AGAR|nr:hypothetical protein MVEN_00139100 [Mycena venus]